ncbi:hypothetical protein [uncultured Cetobacterium sp.]|uniref:hypothetical protein n=1 Tax=uncultured Cetobacterium sp. TaxID=527638 RepID=UPI0026289635|nr:hypothetical protein [uncultured Cetobacterium sp.]
MNFFSTGSKSLNVIEQNLIQDLNNDSIIQISLPNNKTNITISFQSVPGVKYSNFLSKGSEDEDGNRYFHITFINPYYNEFCGTRPPLDFGFKTNSKLNFLGTFKVICGKDNTPISLEYIFFNK